MTSAENQEIERLAARLKEIAAVLVIRPWTEAEEAESDALVLRELELLDPPPSFTYTQPR